MADCPIPDYLQRKIGELDPRYASVFDEVTFWSSRFGALMFEHLPLSTAIRGLDVGCATGFPLFELARVHGPASSFVGVDIWGAAIDRARVKQSVYGIPNVELLEADASSLPFPDASFDLVTSNLGLNNFSAPATAVAECQRVLRPGGRLVVTTNVTGQMREVYEHFRAAADRLNRNDLRASIDQEEAHRGTPASVQNLLTGSGLRIEKIVESSFALRYANGSAMFRHGLVRFFLDGWRGVIGDLDEVDFFSIVEASLNDLAAARGGLAFDVPMLYVQARKPG